MLAWPPASYAGIRFGFSCLANFAPTQNSPNTIRPQPRKNSLNNSFLFILAAAKKLVLSEVEGFIKGVFYSMDG